VATDVILLDTHALLWWALDPDRLSPTASEHCERMEAVGGYASSISLWEIGIKVKRGHLDLGITVEELARRIEQGAVVELLPVDVTTWLKSVELVWTHRDPADRVIVATALLRGLPLLTKDQVLHEFAEVETIW
jgi:PIN domain nuclease of toxin-antitoxin system